MKIEQEQLDQLKQKHPCGVFEGSIAFADEDNVQREVEFLYRKPSTADIESHTKAAQRNPIIANLNLLQSMIVYPDAAQAIAQIREYPAAYGRFVDEAVAPFFGANVTVRSRKL
jgi:hypothetical protein